MITFDEGDITRTIRHDGARIGTCSCKPLSMFGIYKHDASPELVDEAMAAVAELWRVDISQVKRPILPVDPSRIPESSIDDGD